MPFASRLIYGLPTELPIEGGAEVAVSHGALAMTTPRYTSIVTLGGVSGGIDSGGVRGGGSR
jgi:hypothetical protein